MRLGLGLGLQEDLQVYNVAPTDISWAGSHTVAENAALGTQVGGTLSFVDPDAGATGTFSLTDDHDGWFGIGGDGTSIIVTGVPDFETDSSPEIIVRFTDQGGLTYDEQFTITLTDVSETPPPLPPPEGEIEHDGTFTNAPTVTTVDGAVKLSGKKAGGSSGKFLYDLGPATAGNKYTLKYDPDFSLMMQQGKLAFVGFGLKQGTDFHLVGLKGDGSASGVNAYQISGDDLWNATSGFTTDDGGDAAHGNQAGPNWVQFEVSADGSTYTFRTSSDGGTWADEYTAQMPSPHSTVTGPAQFGIAAFFDSTDTGPFSIAIELWEQIIFNGVLARKSADQNAANYTTDTAITWDAEDYDTDALHDTGSNTDRITIPAGLNGRYGVFHVNAYCTNNANGVYGMAYITKNGAVFIGMGAAQTASPNGIGVILEATSQPVLLATGDIYRGRLFISGDTSVDFQQESSAISLEIVG